MKIRIQLTGGMPIRCLRKAEEEDGPVFGETYDTWPLDDLCADIFSRDYDTEFDALAATVQILNSSATAQALINEACAAGWELGLSDLEGADFHIDVPEKKIILANNGLAPAALMRTPYFLNDLMVSLLRALRDIWHEKRHRGFDDTFAPESVLMLERVRAADCDVIALLAAWELRAENYGSLWRHMLAGEEGDMAMAFSAMLERHIGAPVQKGLAAAFTQWYQGVARGNACDHETLEYMDEVIRQAPKGRAFGKKQAGPGDIEVLSCLPDRTAYLQHNGAEILKAPLYAGLHDTVNQSHFLQILHDMRAVEVQGVAFQDAGLAAKIFPGGGMTPEKDAVSETFR